MLTSQQAFRYLCTKKINWVTIHLDFINDAGIICHIIAFTQNYFEQYEQLHWLLCLELLALFVTQYFSHFFNFINDFFKTLVLQFYLCLPTNFPKLMKVIFKKNGFFKNGFFKKEGSFCVYWRNNFKK